MVGEYSGVLLIGHGTREASGNAAFLEIVDQVRQILPGMPVEGSFLEFAQPTIADGIGRLAGQGGTNIAAVPMFLSALGHTANDIPKVMADSAERYQGSESGGQDSGVRGQGSESGGQGSGFRVQDTETKERQERVEITLMSHVGGHQRVVELSALRFRQSLEGKREIPAVETLLIIAAHGSPESEAIEELSAFAARREKLTPVGRVEPCFAVLGQPQLADVIKKSVSLHYKRIVVQPHLLLRGRYHDKLRNQVETLRGDYPDIDWIVTEPLGPDKLLALAIVETLND